MPELDRNGQQIRLVSESDGRTDFLESRLPGRMKRANTNRVAPSRPLGEGGRMVTVCLLQPNPEGLAVQRAR